MAEERKTTRPFVSRAGLKLDHALNEFGVDVTGRICADFGCSVGGFTDCLLQRGAKRVYAIDTAYGGLDYRLRTDPRVVVMERTNALHVEPSPEKHDPGGCDLVVIDLGWTPQRLAVPAALRWLQHNPTPTPSGGAPGRATPPSIITLIKPHYELSEDEKRTLLIDGRLAPTEAERVFRRVLDEMPLLRATVRATTRSPITGGKSSRRGAGTVEYLALLAPSPSPPPECDG
jgi:23S rRNA (cytidine1920-2'-O)/16S rRNA (cytidine1409-2'-O)-methyltransferase